MCYSEILGYVLECGFIEILDQTCQKPINFTKIRIQGPVSELTINNRS